MPDIKGGCLCGRVRYTISATPVFTSVCHCRNCQRFTGSAFELVLGFPREAVQIEGERRIYEDVSDAGRAVLRGFCPTCGSSLTSELAASPKLLVILGGTLDDPSWVQPGVELFCASAQPWVALGGERRKFDGMPPVR